MKSLFKCIVRESLEYESLLKTLGLSGILLEDKNDNMTYIVIAKSYYKQLLERVRERLKKGYPKSGALHIKIADFDVYIDTTKKTSYNTSYYDKTDGSLYLHTADLNTLPDDQIFASHFMHEIIHHLVIDEDFDTEDYKYIKYENDKIKYYTQPHEMIANTGAICQFIIGIIRDSVRNNVKEPDITDKDSIKKFITGLLAKLITSKGFLFYDFLQALSKDKKKFMNFYTEVVDTCTEYIQSNIKECSMYATYNSLKENQNVNQSTK